MFGRKGAKASSTARQGRPTERRAFGQQPLERADVASHIVVGTTVTFFPKFGRPEAMSVAAARAAGLL